MSGWLPPGCTDKDIDDACPSEPEEEFTEAEWMQILIERTATSAENELNNLVEEFGEYERVRQIVERISEKLPKRIT
jgi:hypothetical protein